MKQKNPIRRNRQAAWNGVSLSSVCILLVSENHEPRLDSRITAPDLIPHFAWSFEQTDDSLQMRVIERRRLLAISRLGPLNPMIQMLNVLLPLVVMESLHGGRVEMRGSEGEIGVPRPSYGDSSGPSSRSSGAVESAR